MIDKVNNIDSVTFLILTPIYKWHVVGCGYKNRYQKDICFKNIGLCAKKMMSILGSIVMGSQFRVRSDP